jgi:hypothetical protein
VFHRETLPIIHATRLAQKFTQPLFERRARFNASWPVAL